MSITVSIEPRNCGKPNCSKCPHGPYVYLIDRYGKRTYAGRAASGIHIGRTVQNRSHKPRKTVRQPPQPAETTASCA